MYSSGWLYSFFFTGKEERAVTVAHNRKVERGNMTTKQYCAICFTAALQKRM
jgi:hypothetical protein